MLPSVLDSWGDAIHICTPCMWHLRRAFKIYMLTGDEIRATKEHNE